MLGKMKRYLVIFLFVFSFIANSSGVASVFSGFNKVIDSIPVASLEPHDSLQLTKMSDHCHQLKVPKTLSDADCDMQFGGACDNCFTHCGGALLTAEFPSFIAPSPLFVSSQIHFYTPLLNSSFLRPPQIS